MASQVGGSVRVARSLVLLKKRYPARVTLLLGNRDLNKMRLTSELAPSQVVTASRQSPRLPSGVSKASFAAPPCRAAPFSTPLCFTACPAGCADGEA